MNTKLDTCGSASGGLRARNTKYEIRTTKYERRTTSYGPVLRFSDLSSEALQGRRMEGGFVLPLVLVAMVILMALVIGATMTSYSSRLQAVQTKAQTEAMLAAEAGYEQALFWMSQQTDLLGDIQAGDGEGTIDFGTGSCRLRNQLPRFHRRKTCIQSNLDRYKRKTIVYQNR